MMNFAAKTIAFALFFIVFLFADSLSAADGCQASGCDTSADGQYNATAFSKPTYAPSWTEVTKSMGPVRGGQYLKFSVVEGEIYTWSTEGKEDVFGGNYSATCSSDEISDNCRTASDTELRGLRCFGGYCTLPFDTELTLLKGEVCTATAQPIAYSNSGGFRNQSSLEWKADFTGPVVLLVTNNKYQGGVTSASSGSYIPCQKTSQKEVGPSGAEMEMTTTVKWQRSASEPCSTCGEKTKYRTDKTALSPEQAPKWRTVQSRQAVNLLDFLPTPITPENLTGNYPNDKWLKPGSYVVFNVIENQIYRWSTCIADFQDTQLTLFKGDQGGTGDDGKACGQVLAYGDDSKVSYTSAKRIDDEGHEIDDEDPAHFATFCPAGTKQTVLEWKANFTGKVTLLLNEYNCYQCYPQEVALSGGITYNNWLNCFYEVTGSFQTDGGEFVFENGWPVEVASGDPSSMPGSFIYPFPLDWQRYDCDTCEGAPVKTIDDFSETPGTNAFTDGGSQVVYAGQPLLFNLKRGSKYLFEAADENTIITIKRGNSCDGDLVDQASGKLTYFAEAEGDYDSEGHYIDEPDVITVFISPQDCREDDDFSDTLTYSYYTSAGNSKTRFLEAQYTGSDNVVTDSSTTLQFVDTGEWAHTWQEAINTCQNKTVGNSGSGNTIPCLDPVCPEGNYTFQNGYFCKYNSTGADASGNCKSPVCATNYSEFQKTSANANDPELQDLFGLCYYSGTQCDINEWITIGVPDVFYARPPRGCDDGDEYIAAKAKCGHCSDGILENIGTALKPNWVCRDTQCKSSQQCITIGGFCSSIGAEQSSCPEGYIYLSSKNKCFDPDGAVPVYGTPTDSGEAMRWPNTGISYTSTASGCPSGMDSSALPPDRKDSRPGISCRPGR